MHGETKEKGRFMTKELIEVGELAKESNWS